MANIFSGIDKWNESYLENTYHIFFKKPPLSRSCETTEPQSQKKIY